MLLVDRTEARIVSRCCTVEYRQLNMGSQSIQFCAPWPKPILHTTIQLHVNILRERKSIRTLNILGSLGAPPKQFGFMGQQ